ncbi:MAG: hypothetical protein U0871_29445 [Gemmataceae bacterium]
MAQRDFLPSVLALAGAMTPELRAAIVPDPHPLPVNERAVADAVRGGRDALTALLAGLLVEDRIAAAIGGGPDARAAVAADLHGRYPAGKPVSTQYLDLKSTRDQRLEYAVRLLSAVLVEVLYPSDRAEIAPVYVSSRRTA